MIIMSFLMFHASSFSGECNKDVAVALITFHDCSLDAKIKMNLGKFID